MQEKRNQIDDIDLDDIGIQKPFNKWINFVLPTVCVVMAIIIKVIYKDDPMWRIGSILCYGIAAVLYAIGLIRYKRQNEIKLNWLVIGLILAGLSATFIKYYMGHMQNDEIVTWGVVIGTIGVGTIVYDLVHRSKVILYICFFILCILGCYYRVKYM